MKHLFTLKLILALFLSLPALQIIHAKSQPPNKYELAIIEEQIRASFKTLLQIWKEELYFEMYDFGQQKTQDILQKADFVQRMVDLKWKPALEKEKITRVHIIYRNFGAIHVQMTFQNKINPLNKIRKQVVLPIILEKKLWKYDLTQLIRTPYIGKIPPSQKTDKPPEAGSQKANAPATEKKAPAAEDKKPPEN